MLFHPLASEVRCQLLRVESDAQKNLGTPKIAHSGLRSANQRCNKDIAVEDEDKER